MSIQRLTSSNCFEAKRPVACPLCGNIGIGVKRVIVEHMISEDVQINSGIDDFRICMIPDCDVVYYCGIPEIRYVKNQIRVQTCIEKACHGL